MAWTDKPTKAQLFAIDKLMTGYMSTPMRVLAVDYLERTKTRRDVSDEMGRLRDLYMDRKLSKYNVFKAKIWEGFDYEEDQAE